MKFILGGYVWRFYVGSFKDFIGSEDEHVRRAWWFLWHNGQPWVKSRNRCYRFCGLTLFGRPKPNVKPASAAEIRAFKRADGDGERPK